MNWTGELAAVRGTAAVFPSHRMDWTDQTIAIKTRPDQTSFRLVRFPNPLSTSKSKCSQTLHKCDPGQTCIAVVIVGIMMIWKELHQAVPSFRHWVTRRIVNATATQFVHKSLWKVAKLPPHQFSKVELNLVINREVVNCSEVSE